MKFQLHLQELNFYKNKDNKTQAKNNLKLIYWIATYKFKDWGKNLSVQKTLSRR